MRRCLNEEDRPDSRTALFPPLPATLEISGPVFGGQVMGNAEAIISTEGGKK